jgi:hypothetical protein
MVEEKHAYPVKEDINAIIIDDNYKFDKDHFLINEKYRVSHLVLF